MTINEYFKDKICPTGFKWNIRIFRGTKLIYDGEGDFTRLPNHVIFYDEILDIDVCFDICEAIYITRIWLKEDKQDLLCADLRDPEASKKILIWLSDHKNVELTIKSYPTSSDEPTIVIKVKDFLSIKTFSFEHSVQSDMITDELSLNYYILDALAAFDTMIKATKKEV